MPADPTNTNTEFSDRFPWIWFLAVSFIGSAIWTRAYWWKFGFRIEPILLSVLIGWLVAQLVRFQRQWLSGHDFRSGKPKQIGQGRQD
jgi:hypothetical protein